MRLGSAEQKCPAEQEEDQADVADEVLVEGAGVGDARHGNVPIFGGDEHEDAVRYPQSAHQNGER